MRHLKGFRLFENLSFNNYRKDYIKVLKKYITLPRVFDTNRNLWVLLECGQTTPYVFFKPYIIEGDITLDHVNIFIQRKGFQRVVDNFFSAYVLEKEFSDGLKKTLKQMCVQTEVDPVLKDIIWTLVNGFVDDVWNIEFEEI